MEVYGVKPKRFTQEWWGYFWYYYKWHTLAAAFAAVIIIYSGVQCATQPKYDLQVDYISEYGITQEKQDAVTRLIEENIDDTDGNGKINAFLLCLNMQETQDAQMMQAMQTKLMLEMGYSESYVFIMTKRYAEVFSENEALEPVSVWYNGDAEDEFTVSLKDSEVLKNLGIDTEGQELYIGVRAMNEKEKKHSEKTAAYENGVKLAKYLTGRE